MTARTALVYLLAVCVAAAAVVYVGLHRGMPGALAAAITLGAAALWAWDTDPARDTPNEPEASPTVRDPYGTGPNGPQTDIPLGQ